MTSQSFAIHLSNSAVLATVSCDAHSWNLVYLQLLLEEEGYRVANLGPCTEISAVLDAAADPDVRIVVLSTINGHGGLEAAGYARDLRARYPDRDLRIVIGGKLTTDGVLDEALRAGLLAAGFDEVYTGADAADRFRASLRADECRRTLAGAGVAG